MHSRFQWLEIFKVRRPLIEGPRQERPFEFLATFESVQK